MKNTYSLQKLQMAYLPVTLRKEKNNDQTCMYCWSTGCGCSTNSNVKTDSFINLTAEELRYA